MDFNLVNLALTLRTDDAVRLTLYLSLFGNEFASACRRNVCRWPERVCDACPRQDSCQWDLVFGQKLSSDPSELKRHQKPPLPFVFSFPHTPDSAKTNLEMECGLVVIGQAIPCLNVLLDGFADLLASGACPVPAELVRVGSRDYQGTVHPLGDGCCVNYPNNMVVLSCNGLLEGRAWANSFLKIRLLSPLRLVVDGHILDHFDFSRFARSLMRRVSSLAYYYGECEYICDFKELSRQSEAVTCTDDRFSYNVGLNRKVSGLLGYGSFCGELSGLMPFLAAGLYVHAGKGASFGMGMFELPE
jgi:hypothetical protein